MSRKIVSEIIVRRSGLTGRIYAGVQDKREKNIGVFLHKKDVTDDCLSAVLDELIQKGSIKFTDVTGKLVHTIKLVSE
jgi:hypothetical protein